MSLPTINIFHAALLDRAFGECIELISKVPEEKKWMLTMSSETLQERIGQYKEAWSQYETQILEAIHRITDLQFTSSRIDVHVIKNFWRPFSRPLVISAKCDPDEFIDVLTHELIHMLFVQNAAKIDVVQAWSDMYPDIQEQKIRSHVVLHAIHKIIYFDELKAPYRYERNYTRNTTSGSGGYVAAWDRVAKDGHKETIEKFKTYYKK